MMQERQQKPMTLRISNVPTESSKEYLQQYIRSISSSASTELCTTLQSVNIRSFARCDKELMCATATAWTNLPRQSFVTMLNDAFIQDGNSLHCDCDFCGITPLSDVGSSEMSCDIVAVTGLASNAAGSWQIPGQDTLWLRDWLPLDLPRLRVLLYGYDTKLLMNESISNIEDLGRTFLDDLATFRKITKTNQRPTIFIGYSLGGLLIKEALLYSHENCRPAVGTPPMHRYCIGLLFFGVPHLGLRSTTLSTIVRGKPNQKLIDAIVVDEESEASSYLQRLTDQFARRFEGLVKVVSFFERHRSPTIELRDDKLSMTGPPMLMVTMKSATNTGLTSISDVNSKPIEANHFELVKFNSKHKGTYLVVREQIQEFIDASSTHRESYAEPLVAGRTQPQDERRVQHLIKMGGNSYGGSIVMNGGHIDQSTVANVKYRR